MRKYHTVQTISGLVCVLVIFYVVIPLFGKQFIPTHDGEYHIIRIVEFAKMIEAGYWFPRWAPTLNSGYGIPIFEFHYPLPNYVGAFVGVFTHDAVRAFQISMAVGYMVAIFALYVWLRRLFLFYPALVGTIVGAFMPYWFVDIYVRGSIGEVWATAFLFLTLYCVERKKYVLVSIAFGLLIVSHNILAMVYAPFLVLYMVFQDKKALWGLVGGLGLSAFFWFPAILEQKYVTGLNTVNFREHFAQIYELFIPSWGTEFSSTGAVGNKMSLQIGIAALASIIGAVIVHRNEKDKRKKQLSTLFFCIFILAVILMLPLSTGIWERIKPMQLIQYPWRLLSLVIPIASYCAAYWVRHMKRKCIGVILALSAVFLSLGYIRPVTYEPRNEAYYLSRPNFTDGTSSMGNSFSTIWTGWKNVRPESEIIIQNGNLISRLRWQYLYKEFIVQFDIPGEIILNTIYFPGWRATVDAREAPINFTQDGIIHVLVSQGSHIVKIWFSDTLPRRIGNIVSLFSLAFIAVWGILPLYKSKVHKVKSP